MNLNDILKNTNFKKLTGNTNLEIADIIYDSRKVIKNCIFVCLSGSTFDGHDFINDAIIKGASVIVTEKNLDVPTSVTTILVENSRAFLARISADFFGNPTKKIKAIGITGTKGKTTTSFMIKSIIEETGSKCGIIGTIGAIYNGKIFKLENTTPESYEIQKHLSNMLKHGYEYAVMEVSSIGLKTHRVDGFAFDIGVFTNFSNDHIGKNEHSNMKEYLECKKMLFKRCNVGIINRDCKEYSEIINDSTCKTITFGEDNSSDYKINKVELKKNYGDIGIKLEINGKISQTDFEIPIPGKFNAYNAASAVAVCNELNIDIKSIFNGLKKVKVKGRCEKIYDNLDFSIFIDYAHNAVSMENILKTMREYSPTKLIVLFGAGGNRPKIRRYEMGEVAGNLADLSIITSDNPRYENPIDIIEDIKIGINKTNGKYLVIPGRVEAIKYCIENAEPGNIIVLAGKGHEDYQEIKGVKYKMDERLIVTDILSSK